MRPALTPGQEIALLRDTIERAAKGLTAAQVNGLTNLAEGKNWDFGRGRAGGAVSRMFDRMVGQGLVTSIPHKLTPFGRNVLAARTKSR